MILFRKRNTIFAIFFERIGFFINFVLLLPYKAHSYDAMPGLAPVSWYI